MRTKCGCDLLQCRDDVRVVGVETFLAQCVAFVVVHAWLDAAGHVLVPATVIHANDWGCTYDGVWMNAGAAHS